MAFSVITFAVIALSAITLGGPVAAEASDKNLLAELEVQGRSALDEVHRLVRDEFFDADLRSVDWDAARGRALEHLARRSDMPGAAINAMLDELKTSHLRYLTVEEPAYYHLLSIFETFLREEHSEHFAARFGDGPVRYAGIGLFLRTLGEHVVVAGVLDGAPAAEAGVLRGDVLLALDREPVRHDHTGGALPVSRFASRMGSTIPLRVERRAGEIVELEVEPRELEPATLFLDAMRASARIEEVKIGASGTEARIQVAYIHVWSYAGQQYQDLLEELLLYSDELAQAEALVLDLREGWGGASPSYLNLFNTAVPVLTSIGRDGEPRVFDSQWRKPTVLLVDGTVRSGKELLAYGFRKHGIGPVVGERTAGAVTAGGPRILSDGSLLYLTVADVRVDGERLEGVGVVPDVEVAAELLHAAGRDPQLQRALEIAAAEAARRPVGSR